MNPQPCGFTLHCVFVIHSAHQLALAATADERLLPLFWALDYFKEAQDRDAQDGDFVLGPVRGALPAAEAAPEELRRALEEWNVERAERAVVALVRSQSVQDVFELLWCCGARDIRNLAHKAIFVANAERTLRTIGAQHAEPTLRSVVSSLLYLGRDGQSNGFAFEDQCYLGNVDRTARAIGKLPAGWDQGRAGDAVTRELLPLMCSAQVPTACQAAADLLSAGQARADDLWDGVHVAAAELMIGDPGIVGVHAVTSANALHHAFRSARANDSRLLLLLQGVGWMGHIAHMLGRSSDRPVRIERIDEDRVADDPGRAADEILALVSTDADAAGRKACAYARRFGESAELVGAARRLIFAKATESHQYKFPAAIFEDLGQVAPAWRPHLLAAAMFYLRGSTLPDSPVMIRAREAVRRL